MSRNPFRQMISVHIEMLSKQRGLAALSFELSDKAAFIHRFSLQGSMLSPCKDLYSWFILIPVPFKTQERKPWATSSSNIPHCPSEGFTVTGHVLHFTSSLPAALYVFSDKAGVNGGTVVISSDNNSCSFFIPIKHRQHKNCVC